MIIALFVTICGTRRPDQVGGPLLCTGGLNRTQDGRRQESYNSTDQSGFRVENLMRFLSLLVLVKINLQ